ncbi:hypothetical protein AF332_20520 [Sporosarcina globispora]|uniref:Peptidase G2 IMC autoproteolytic cleavage domain-containing protein n=1 Tax=Sporosarcina globispora TaxID=1459 RepID=A0A0M0GGN1_SPOGL|nr:hypothetical protein [Sporosarcina globispora]KON88938.1 hypothetical protein AF332_20520 [Sporosarcina globispora]
MALIRGESSNPNEPAVLGTSNAPDQGMGVMGTATRGSGVIGTSVDWIGVYGESNNYEGVRGTSKNKDHAGVVGTNEAGGSAFYGEGSAGLIAVGKQWVGVYGETQAQPGVGSAGVWGDGKNGGDGVKGHASAPGKSAVAGIHLTNQGPGIRGKGSPAGFFEGDVHVTGNIRANGDIILSNADCAEDFDVFEADTIEPGTVMIFGEGDSLLQSQYAYDKRVVGVISGAGNYKPGIILDKQQSLINRKPVALMGKVYCKVDAGYAPIKVGDLLTTSDTPGHAMKATDPLKAFGTVIGKAMHPLKEGQGLIPILVALQ